MAGVMPKISLYAFLSVICLLINFSVFATSLIETPETDYQGFLGETEYTDKDLLENEGDAVIGNFVLAGGSSFIPFFSLVSLAIISDLPSEVTAITGIVLAIIGSFQVFLLLVIILNLAPKVLGSGWDV